MTYNPRHVPSKRYDPFITFFEKQVTEAQRRIKQIEKLEHLYNIARDSLLSHNLPNEIKLDHVYSGIEIHIRMTEDNHYEDFDPLITTAGQRLHEHKYHEDGIPSKSSTNGWYIRRTFHLKDDTFLTFILQVPNKGTKYCLITERDVPRIEREVCFTWRAKAEGPWKEISL